MVHWGDHYRTLKCGKVFDSRTEGGEAKRPTVCRQQHNRLLYCTLDAFLGQTATFLQLYPPLLDSKSTTRTAIAQQAVGGTEGGGRAEGQWVTYIL